MPELSIIIPIYNEEGNIPNLIERLKSVVDSMGLSYEFIFINDGSKDKSLNMIKQYASQHSFIRYIDLSRNFGHQIAVSAGLDYSKGKAIVIIDADLQDPPELIIEMYEKYKRGYEVVYAQRAKRAGETVFKTLTAKYFYRIISRITSINIPVDTGDFRIIDRKVVDVLKQMPEQQKFLRGQIAWVGFNQTFITYNRAERNAGETGYTVRKMLKLALDGITSFSDFPLKFATFSGFVVSGVAFVMILYALYSRYIIQDYVPGWTSLMLAVLFLGGIQLISIGIIGEYISRMSANVRQRPLYVIGDTNISEQIESEQ